jgi:hypothetical protein
MARPHALADPDYVKEVAEAFANGCTREEMAETFSVTKATITRWRKDPRVKRQVHTILGERVQRVSSKVDSVIEARLQNAENLTIKELLDIRREFVGSNLRNKLDEADGDTINAAMAAVEDPEFVAAMEAAMSGSRPEE